MNYRDKLQLSIRQVEQELATANETLASLEQELANVKLNPYGITSIDFAKRQELSRDAIKMEGVIMGLTLSLETFDDSSNVTID